MSFISPDETFGARSDSLGLLFPPQKVEKKRMVFPKKRQRAKSVVFSKLPLTLKKQFLHLLTQNEVDFVKDGKFMEAHLQLKEDNIEPGDIKFGKIKQVKPRYMDCLNAKGKRCFHKGCKLQDWEKNNLKKRRARMRRQTFFRQKRSKSQCDIRAGRKNGDQ